jgi:tetratricopeptide (TPR) repeat protein
VIPPPVSGESAHPLVGRTEILEEIDRALEEANAGRGLGVLLRGAGGTGKTEILEVCARRARDRGFRVLVSRAIPGDLPSPYSLLEGFRAWESDREATAPRPPAGRAPVFPLPLLAAPRAASRAPRSSPGGDEEDVDRLLPPLVPNAAGRLGAVRGEQLARLIEEVLGLSRTQPLLLAVDDLHVADAASLEFLRRLGEEIGSSPIVILATAGVEPGAAAFARTQLDKLARSSAFRTIDLRPFTVAELGEFATAARGGAPASPEDITRWYAQTEGNPLLVEQLLRRTDDAELRGPPSGERGSNLVEDLRQRARSLPDAERRILAYAVVLGREVDPDRLAAAARAGRESVDEALRALARAGILRARGRRVFEFVSEAARGALYAELTETRRRILHRRVGSALEAAGGTGEAELARHFYLGRDDLKAIEYNVRASRTATRAFAFDTAIAHLQRVLEAERRTPKRDRRREVRTLTEIGRLWDELGELARSEAALVEAVALAPTEPPHDLERGRALLGLATTRLDRGDFRSAQTLAREALPLLERSGSAGNRLAAQRVLGAVAWRLADVTSAEQHQRAALQIAEESGTGVERGHAIVDVANTLVERGPEHFEAALTLYARAAGLFARGDDHSARARVQMNRAVLEFWLGRRPDALRDIEEALAEAERSRSPIWIGYCLLNRAQWEAQLGRPDDAEKTLERAVQATAPLGDRVVDEQVAITEGMIAEARGRLDEARQQYERALGLARELGMVTEIAEILVRSARILLLAGDAAEARRRRAEARGLGLLEIRSDLAAVLADLERGLGPVAR